MVTRAALLIFLAIFLLAPTVRAGDTPILTGSTLNNGEAVSKSDAIFIGKITVMGSTIPTSPAMATFLGTKVKVDQVLQGSVGAEISASITILAQNHEVPPEKDLEYLFFVHKNAEPGRATYTAIKLLPSTDDMAYASFGFTSLATTKKIAQDEAIKLASRLTYGMPEKEALGFLKEKGLTKDVASGGSFGWCDDFHLSTGTLQLVIEPKHLQPNGEWANGLLKKASILSKDGKENVSILLINAPKLHR